MRRCPKCHVDLEVVKKTFAEIDVCPQCGGVFLDPGEGASLHGSDGDGSFLVEDGRAHVVRISDYSCPSTDHPPATMKVYAIGFAERSIEFEHCPTCKGFFLDHGEGAALDALESRDVTTGSGARFSAPPAVDRQSIAIDQARADGGKGFFETFVTDLFTSAARGGQVLDANGRKARRRRFFGGD